MLAEERHRAVLQLLAEHTFVSVQSLVECLRVSEITVRRDLALLESEGKLKRLRGGAKARIQTLPSVLVGHPAFVDAQQQQRAEKRAIAAQAAQLVSAGESIIIDFGTTTFAMVDHLRELPIRVMTSSLPVAEQLFCSDSVQLLLPGGPLYRSQRLILTAFDAPIVECYSAAIMFMGTLAIGPEGLLQADPLLVRAQRRLRERADRLVVLADHSKFAARGSLAVCPLNEIDTVVTDDRVPPGAITMLEDAGVGVVVARTPKQRRSNK